MREVRRVIAGRNQRHRDLVALERCRLEGVHVFQSGVGRQGVPRHVEQRRFQVFAEVVALVELLGVLDLIDERLRHRRAGLVVFRVVRKYFRFQRPMLVEL